MLPVNKIIPDPKIIIFFQENESVFSKDTELESNKFSLVVKITSSANESKKEKVLYNDKYANINKENKKELVNKGKKNFQFK